MLKTPKFPPRLTTTKTTRDSLAALALASDPPTPAILARQPTARSAPLISTTMWKMILGQTIFQLAVSFTLYYAGPGLLSKPADGTHIRSLVFNTFVWMQVFNMFNNRRLDNGLDILAGAHRNPLFLLVLAVMVGCQVMIMYVGGRAFTIGRLGATEWGISVGVAAICLPWAVLIRLVPDEGFERVVRFLAWPVVAMVYRPLRRWGARLGCSGPGE